MRKTLPAAIAMAVLCALGTSGDAGAAVTIDLEWGACGGGAGGCFGVNTDEVQMSPGGGQTLRLDVYLRHDEPGGLLAHSFSLNFDTDLANELNFDSMKAVRWSGTDADPRPGSVSNYEPIGGIPTTVESTSTTAGRVNSLESGSLLYTLPISGAAYSVGTVTATAPARYRVAQIFFLKTAVTQRDGPDVFAGLFDFPFDVFLDSNGDAIPTERLIFGSAAVGIPEPATLSLVALGLVGLAAAARVRRGA